MPGLNATDAPPRCGRCIGSSAKRNRRHNIRNPNCGRGSLVLEGATAPKAPRRADTVTWDATGAPSTDRGAAESRIIDTIPPVEAEDYPWALAAAAQEDVSPPADQDPSRPDTKPADNAITTPNTAAPLTDVESAKPGLECTLRSLDGGTGTSSSSAPGRPGSRYSTPKGTPTSSRAFKRWRGAWISRPKSKAHR